MNKKYLYFMNDIKLKLNIIKWYQIFNFVYEYNKNYDNVWLIIPCVCCLLFFGYGWLFLSLCHPFLLTSYSVLHITSRQIANLFWIENKNEIIKLCWTRNKIEIIELCWIEIIELC